MNRRASAIILLVGIVACTVSPPVPAVSPTLAPNRVETGVAGTKTAWAEGTVIAKTAEASQVTRAPLPTNTLEPTFTRLPPTAPPAITRIVPPPTSAPAYTRAITPTGTPVPEGTVVQGSVYGIKLKGVKKTDSYSFSPSLGNTRRFYPEPNHVFLEVGVEFYKNGIQVWEDKERLELSVVDSKGNAYQIANPEHIIIAAAFDLQTLKTTTLYNYTVYFSVPSTAVGLKLRYRDLPAIDLGL